MTQTVSDFERAAQIVGEWGAQAVQDIVKALMPDGKPFGYVEDPAAKMRDYLQLRGNPQAWLEFITTEATNITTKLQSSGLAQDKILAVHPYDLAQKFAAEFSFHMEEELRKNAGTLSKPARRTSRKVLSSGSSSEGTVYNSE